MTINVIVFEGPQILAEGHGAVEAESVSALLDLCCDRMHAPSFAPVLTRSSSRDFGGSHGVPPDDQRWRQPFLEPDFVDEELVGFLHSLPSFSSVCCSSGILSVTLCVHVLNGDDVAFVLSLVCAGPRISLLHCGSQLACESLYCMLTRTLF